MITIHIEKNEKGFYQHIAFDINENEPDITMHVCTPYLVNGNYQIWYEIRHEEELPFN